MVAHHPQCELWELCKECNEDRFFVWVSSTLHKEEGSTSVCRDNVLPQTHRAGFLACADWNRSNNITELFFKFTFIVPKHVDIWSKCFHNASFSGTYGEEKTSFPFLREKNTLNPNWIQQVSIVLCWGLSNLSSVLSRLQNHWVAWCHNSSFLKSAEVSLQESIKWQTAFRQMHSAPGHATERSLRSNAPCTVLYTRGPAGWLSTLHQS